MDKERFLQSGLLEQYVLGLTSGEENEEVEWYAQTFPEIQSEIDSLRNAVKQYAESQISTPDSRVVDQEQTKDHLSISSKKRATSRAKVASQWLMAACLVLFGFFGISQYTQKNNAQQKVNQLRRDFIAYKSDCEKNQQRIYALETQLDFFQHRKTAPLQLEGTNLAPGSKVRVFWNELQKTAMLQVLALPEHPTSKQYQIWADIDGKMVNLGLINSKSEEPQPIRCLPKAASLNITLEPLGGSEEPHVDQLYANVNLQ